jgi:hypothetical protein
VILAIWAELSVGHPLSKHSAPWVTTVYAEEERFFVPRSYEAVAIAQPKCETGATSEARRRACGVVAAPAPASQQRCSYLRDIPSRHPSAGIVLSDHTGQESCDNRIRGVPPTVS